MVLYDLLGRRLQTLVDNRQEAGRRQVHRHEIGKRHGYAAAGMRLRIADVAFARPPVILERHEEARATSCRSGT